MPTILDKIVKDATVYFLVIFGSQLLVECFILFAPVSRCVGLDRIPCFFFPCIMEWGTNLLTSFSGNPRYHQSTYHLLPAK